MRLRGFLCPDKLVLGGPQVIQRCRDGRVVSNEGLLETRHTQLVHELFTRGGEGECQYGCDLVRVGQHLSECHSLDCPGP